MKKQLTLLLAILLGLSMLGGCGDSSTPTTTPSPTAKPTSAPKPESTPEPIAEGETVDADFFSVSYPETWTYDEEGASISSSYANLKFAIYDADDPEKESYSVVVNASKESAKSYRKNFVSAGIELRDLADGNVPSITVDGVDFYESRAGETYRYRHEASGVHYYIRFKSAASTAPDSEPFAELIEGISLNLTDEGETPVPWPWDGKPWEFTGSPQMAGTVTLTPEFLKADEPIIQKDTMETSFTVVGDMVYAVTEDEMTAYRIGDGALTLEQSVKLEVEIETIRTDSAGKLYLSQGIFESFVFDGFDKVAAPGIKHYVVMHPSGTWGLTYWVNSDPMKFTVTDGIFREEPWVLSDINKDETRVGPLKSIDDLRITDSHIILSGSSAEESKKLVIVYDFAGTELLRLEDKPGNFGIGWVTGIIETPNGFLITDGNMRDILLWNTAGVFIGTIDVSKLFGASYCWLEDVSLLDDGSILVAVSQERADKSADELLFFRLTGF